MQTKTELIRLSLLTLGVIRAGGSIPGHVFGDCLAITNQTLRALAEDQALNFDPVPDDQLPDEYMPRLTNIIANQLARPMGKPDQYSPALYEYERGKLYALMVGDSSALDTEQRDF